MTPSNECDASCTPSPPSARTWAASLSGTARRGHGTVPATVRASIRTAGCSTARPRRRSRRSTSRGRPRQQPRRGIGGDDVRRDGCSRRPRRRTAGRDPERTSLNASRAGNGPRSAGGDHGRRVPRVASGAPSSSPHRSGRTCALRRVLVLERRSGSPAPRSSDPDRRAVRGCPDCSTRPRGDRKAPEAHPSAATPAAAHGPFNVRGRRCPRDYAPT